MDKLGFMKNYYDILEIHPDSSIDVIEAAYKSLYRHYNPANFSEPEEVLQAKIMRNQLDEAYKILSNPSRKARYDIYYKKTDGNVETRRLGIESTLVLIALVIIIVAMAELVAGSLFKYFIKLTVLISSSPVLKTILAIILIAIIIHAVHKRIGK